jgi:hypothetical protein
METLAASSNTTHKTSEFPVIQYIMANGSDLNPEAGATHMEIDNKTQFIATEYVLQPLVRSFKVLVNMGVYHEKQLAEGADVNSTSDDIYHFSLKPSWNETFGTKKDDTFGMTFEAKKALSGFVDNLFSGFAHADSFVFRRKFGVEGNLCYIRRPASDILQQSNQLKLPGQRSTNLCYAKYCFCGIENHSRHCIHC